MCAESGIGHQSGSGGLRAVEAESYRLTGNEAILSHDTKGSDTGVAPEGRITIEDPQFSATPQGVKGVKVSCNTFVKFASTYTDEDGYYKMDKTFSGKPRYRIVYKNKYGFAQGFNLILSPASYTSLRSCPAAGFNLDVTSSSNRKLFTRCAVNNAAYDYYKQCKTGDSAMRLPPANLRIWQFRKLRKAVPSCFSRGDDKFKQDCGVSGTVHVYPEVVSSGYHPGPFRMQVLCRHLCHDRT